MNHRSITRPQLSVLVLLFATLAFAPASEPAPAPSATPAPEELPTFEPDTSVIEAANEFQWMISFRIQNRFGVGIYFDSLICVVQDLDPGETRAERITVFDVSYMVAGNSVSAGDPYSLSYAAPAIAEHARLTFRLVLHRADKRRTTLTTVVEAVPGAVSRYYPSEFLTVNGRRVEYVFFPSVRDSAAGLLLVHGHGSNARRMFRMAQRLGERGYAVMLVSMPGYGQSEGPPDFGGPSTVQALGAALDRLEAAPSVDPKRIAAWGISRGAAPVVLLSQKRDDVRATIAESGSYDLWAVYRAAKDHGRREAIVREAGSDSTAWRERSAALAPGKPAAILILHGEKDVNVPPQQARGFAESLKTRGADVETHFIPGAMHELPPGDVLRTALEFLQRRLGS